MASEKKKVEHITSGVIRYVHFDENMERTYIVEMDDHYAKCKIEENQLIIIETYETEEEWNN